MPFANASIASFHSGGCSSKPCDASVEAMKEMEDECSCSPYLVVNVRRINLRSSGGTAIGNMSVLATGMVMIVVCRVEMRYRKCCCTSSRRESRGLPIYALTQSGKLHRQIFISATRATIDTSRFDPFEYACSFDPFEYARSFDPLKYACSNTAGKAPCLGVSS